MALDYGSARTGVAVSDPTGMLARPLCTVEMESAAMFVVAKLRGLRAGMVCAVSGNLVTGDVVYGAENHRLHAGWEHSVDVALEAAYRLTR